MHMFNRVIHDTHRHGVIPMQDVLAFSSNIGAIKIGMQVGNENLYNYIRRLGFGQRTGIELPGKCRATASLKRWQPTSIGSVPMGHEIGVTSLQLAQMGCVIANGGYLVTPHLVAWEQEPNGPRMAVKHAQPVPVLRPETVMSMRMMMRRVVTDLHGTGHLLHVIGYSLAGKTGTAQIYDYEHKVYTHRYNASFRLFVLANNPAIVIVVTVSVISGSGRLWRYCRWSSICAAFMGRRLKPPWHRSRCPGGSRRTVAFVKELKPKIPKRPMKIPIAIPLPN